MPKNHLIRTRDGQYLVGYIPGGVGFLFVSSIGMAKPYHKETAEEIAAEIELKNPLLRGQLIVVEISMQVMEQLIKRPHRYYCVATINDVKYY